MNRLARVGFLTSGGAGLFTVAVAGWLLQLALSPRLPYRADCQMAWAVISEPDIFLFGCSGLVGVLLGSLYWPRRDALLLTAVRPALVVGTMVAGFSALLLVAGLPGVIALLAAVRSQGGSVCVSASALHLVAAMLFGLAVGMAAAHRLNPVLASVVTLGSLGVIYAAAPSVIDRKLLNVGVTPLPMMDMQRSWPYAAVMAFILVLGAATLLTTIAGGMRVRLVAGAVAGASLLLVATPAAKDFVEIRPDTRVCATVAPEKQACVPQSYRWLGPGVVDNASAMLHAASGNGVDLSLMPAVFELGQFQTSSGRTTAQMSLPSGFISDGRVPALQVAGLLVTPSWCRSMRAEQPPEALLRQTSVMALWFAVKGGYVPAPDAVKMLPDGVVDPATLTGAQITDGLRAAQTCEAASWI